MKKNRNFRKIESFQLRLIYIGIIYPYLALYITTSNQRFLSVYSAESMLILSKDTSLH